MKILVVQLARLGDILQTFPALAGLKERYPGSTIDLVVREKFSHAAVLSPHVDRLIKLPTKTILSPLLQAPESDVIKAKTESLAQLMKWIAESFLEQAHKTGPYDLTINLTFSETSSFLAQLVPSKEIKGLKRAKDGAYAVTDAWSVYTYSQVLRKNINIIHLDDLFSKVCGVLPGKVELLTKGYDSSCDMGKLPIGVQLGASLSEKTLNPKTWALLVKNILTSFPESQILLFGSKEDKERESIVLQEAGEELGKRITSLVGKVKFHENVFWIKRCQFMLTPDTAMVHLAPLCGIKTVNVSVGEVNANETGPYGDGHYILRPPVDMDLENGTQLLSEVLGAIIMEEAIPLGINVSKTSLIECASGAKRNSLVPVNFIKDELMNLFEQSYYLLAEFRNSGIHEDIKIPLLAAPGQPSRLDDLKSCLDSLETMRKVAEFGRRSCLQMIENSKNKEELNNLSERILETEKLLKEISEKVFYIKPLFDIWEVTKENVIGDSIVELASMTEGSFRELVQNIDMVHHLIGIALDHAEARLGINKNKVEELNNENSIS